jgi:predicted HicB family RNase H-like nuclease
MSWRKYFNLVKPDGSMSPVSGGNTASNPMGAVGRRNYTSYLPEVYTGHPNRMERYFQYDQMDQDSEVNAALDIIAEFCSQRNKQSETPFDIQFHDTPTESEALIIKDAVQQFTSLNDWNRRIFRMFRNTLKYGDSFFIRDPETQELIHVHASKCDKIIVNESKGKEPEQYVFRDLNLNLESLSASQVTANVTYSSPGANSVTDQGYGQNRGGAYAGPGSYNQGASGGRFETTINQYAVDANHVCHVSLSEGLDSNFPFGTSILETVFKTFKQKELLEDAIIIYRVHRAPERRVFYIDVGNMPSHMAMGFVERVKNEIHQRRIPSISGGSNKMDATYNPLSINEDYFFPQTAEGRGSKVETLPGGTNLGEIDDLRYFTNKLYRALRIPSSYLPTGPDDGANPQYSDGRVGTAYIQELRFNKYCERLQDIVVPAINREFKLFLKNRGLNIDTSLFDLKFTTPQNFAAYRQIELDNQRVQAFSQIEQTPYLSKRFALKRFLGLSEEEIAQNQKMWAEEHGESKKESAKGSDLRNVGVTGGGIGADTDAQTGDIEPEGDLDVTDAPDAGEEGAPEGTAEV